ncbi:ankyrin [Ascodesmis nigricans]|uniref:Ankyrin n=1 Tax=Ascodesmis nigricans TaxID=341454 RepID=A0A4S2MPS5_9PEZI|nr:ankyrin [Ascodesmis nigricans]
MSPPAQPAPTPAGDEDGASPRELLLEAARRDNTDLLNEVLEKIQHNAEILNSAADALGNTTLHVATQYGSYDVLDTLLDCSGLEVDPTNTLDRDTPLHKAVYLCREDRNLGHAIVDLLLDAGADPRIRNRQKMRPIDVADQNDTELRNMLRQAEYKVEMGDDVVQEDEQDGGSGSESD